MKKYLICISILIFCINEKGFANSNNDTIILPKETFMYSIKGGDTLYLDKYEAVNNNGELSPCMIFVFGGGFYSGVRDIYYYMPYFDFLTKNGYTVISIDYRLGLRKVNITTQKFKAKELINIFENTINMAVEDFFDATNFVLQHAEEWKIDPQKIVASGSSAGAVTVLQGEYYISTKAELSTKLPSTFNYAGVIGFAGAIFSKNGKLKWSQNTTPIQLFHGDADKNVPYDKIKLFRIGLFGSKNITKRLEKAKLPYYFYTVENTDHEVANTPMHLNHEEIKSFLDKYVNQKQSLQTTVTVNPLNKPDIKKNFKLKDYIKTNYAP
jgi:predicted esterase